MNSRLFLLTLAALAFGSGAYVFGGLLDPMAREIGVSVAAAGQLQTAFVFSAAIGGPFLAMWGGNVDRKRLLVVSLAAVTGFTALCVFVSNFTVLVMLRILAGAMGGAVMPAAATVAAALVPPSQRGSAIALVLGGMTLAFLLGIPLGSLIGELWGWKATFLFASFLSAIACAGVAIWLPSVPPAAETGDRRMEWGHALPLFFVTLLSFAATMAVVSYIGPVLERETGVRGGAVGIFQSVIGTGAMLGLVLGGRAANGRRFRAMVMCAFVVIFIAQLVHFALLQIAAPGSAIIMILVGWAIFSSALSLFAIMPVVQARLVGISRESAAMVLALNSSMNYLGQGLGAGLGGFAIRSFGLPSVAVLGAALAFCGMLLAAADQRGISPR